MKVNKILFISIVVIVFIVTLLVILIRPNEIYDEPANAFVADFIGESNIYTGTIMGP